MILQPEAVCEALIGIANLHGMPNCPERNLLREDASALASIFANLRLRFDVVNTNACRKFHIDAVTARLICTYRGTGAQIGLTENGDDPEHILTAPTGSPIILRGTRWPETPISGLLHRSPPIVGTGETRLSLVLDPIEDPVKEAETAMIHILRCARC